MPSDESFVEWLERKEAEARETYKDGPRSEGNARQKDIALGRLRAYRDARRTFLERGEHFDDE